MKRNRQALFVALLAAIISIPASYAIQRIVDVLVHAQANPAITTPSANIAMFTRLTIGAYTAPVFGFIAYELARRDLGRALHGLYAVCVLVAVLAAGQGAFVP